MEKQTIINQIETLKKEKDVLILAHSYVNGELQEIADFLGDSYMLSQRAQAAEEKVILFCGVRFMGESAKILSPEKTILMPDMDADCPMAHMVTPEDVAAVRSQYHDLAVVCYINSTASIKACADVCVTSSNAEKVVRNLPNQHIYFIPDSNLGHYIADRIPEKNFIFHTGYCPVHAALDANTVKKAKKAYPDAKVLMHPECIPEAAALADFLGSTAAILAYPEKDSADTYLIATEEGVLHELLKRYPNKHFYMIKPDFLCEDMKKNTLEKVLHVLETFDKPVTLEKDIREKAEASLKAMHQLAGK